MAFCKYCGTKLEDGQLCNCADAVAARGEAAPAATQSAQTAPATAQEAPAAAQPAQPAQAAPTSNVTITLPNVDKEYVRGIFGQYLNILKAPASGGAAFMNGQNTIPAAVIIALQALLSGLISCFYIGQINGLLKTMMGILGGGDKYKFSGIKAFFISVILSVFFAAVFAGISFGAAKILKLEMDLKQVLELAAVRAAYLAPITALAAFVSLLNVPASLALYLTASLFALCFVLAAMMEKYTEKKNILVYVMTFVTFLLVAVMALVMSKCFTWYIPGSIKDNIGNISDLMRYLS